MTFFSAIGWRLGLQLVTATVFTTFLLGTCYRSASLYHPQRRAILHLKNQKRKIKDKNRHDDRPPFLDFTTLRSKTVRILLVSTGISAFGINTPIFYLVSVYSNIIDCARSIWGRLTRKISEISRIVPNTRNLFGNVDLKLCSFVSIFNFNYSYTFPMANILR